MTRKEDASAKKQEPNYLRYAFHNVYNYTLLGAAAATAALTGEWWLAVVAAGGEGLWMLFGPGSRLLQKLWFDKVHAARMDELARVDRTKLMQSLPEADAERVARTDAQHAQILRLCEENQSFEASLLRDELSKLDQLLRSFVELITSARRYDAYLQTIDFNELERELRSYRVVVEKGRDPEQRKLAQKNLEVLLRRQEKLAEIRRYIATAEGQTDLIENTLQLLADQIVTMRSPKELGGQLDELMDGVEAVRTTARETAAMLEGGK